MKTVRALVDFLLSDNHVSACVPLRSSKNPQPRGRHHRHWGFTGKLISVSYCKETLGFFCSWACVLLFPLRLLCFMTQWRTRTPLLQSSKQSLEPPWLVSSRRWRMIKVCPNRSGNASRWNTRLIAAAKPNWWNWLINCTTWGTWITAHLSVSTSLSLHTN